MTAVTGRRRGLHALSIVLTVLAVALVAGCQPDARSGVASATPVVQTQTTDLESGRKIYNFRCYYCHGYSGDARTLATTYLDPKPRDFTVTGVDELDRAHMLKAIRDGHDGTAMAGFRGILTTREIALVADFVRDEFMVRKAANTRYHTAANGWPKHERYRDAYPFATGEIGLDTPWEKLNNRQAAGKRLYLASCVSCHDRGRAGEDSVVWELRAVSYPPNQDSCLTCHAADGTGRNWIGAFLEPHPRDLTDARAMSNMTREPLLAAIRNGLPGSSMPAWKSVLAEQDIQALAAYISRAFYPIRAH